MSEQQLSAKAKSLGSWLGIHLEITFFGVKILDWRYPPQSDNSPIMMEG